MNYPALIINLNKIEQNTRAVLDQCKKYNISLTAVSKCYCGISEIALAQLRGGATMIADSRVHNLKKLQMLPVKKMLIRIPMISQADDVVRYADYSMNSELKTIKALSNSAVSQGKIHKIVFMIDIGDLREGCLPENALIVIQEIIKLQGVTLEGIGANFGCFGGVMPEYDNLHILVELAEEVKKLFGVDVNIISGGNSFTYTTMVQGQCPKEINHFRLGDILLTGYDTRLSNMVPGAAEDAITMICEIVELLNKPSKPFGRIEKDAFGNVPYFEDKGNRKRAIFAVGRQDIRIEEVFPIEKGMEVLGASSDHMIVDVTEYDKELEVGSLVPFRLTYGALLAAFNSEYVEKVFI